MIWIPIDHVYYETFLCDNLIYNLLKSDQWRNSIIGSIKRNEYESILNCIYKVNENVLIVLWNDKLHIYFSLFSLTNQLILEMIISGNCNNE